MRRSAFTMIELIFVIVIIGILSKYGIGLLKNAYENYFYSKVNNALQAKTEAALESIAARLTYRIKESVIAKKDDGSFSSLPSATYAEDATVLEWLGYDIDGYRGINVPLWSGIIDIDSANTNQTQLYSPQTSLSFEHGALFFVGEENIDVYNGFGWSGELLNQGGSIHPVNISGNGIFTSDVGVNFSGATVYENYLFIKSAYAIENDNGTLYLYTDYKPWRGQTFADGNKYKLMENVDTFRFRMDGTILRVQLCVKSDMLEEYSLCKEKTIF